VVQALEHGGESNESTYLFLSLTFSTARLPFPPSYQIEEKARNEKYTEKVEQQTQPLLLLRLSRSCCLLAAQRQ